jgi:hypothetical protein
MKSTAFPVMGFYWAMLLSKYYFWLKENLSSFSSKDEDKGRKSERDISMYNAGEVGRQVFEKKKTKKNNKERKKLKW